MKFTAGDRTYSLRIDYIIMRRVEEEAGVDLSIIEESLPDFYRGSPKLLDVLWVICKPQAQGMTLEQFQAPIRGQVIEDAINALVEAVTDFFLPSRAKSVGLQDKSIKDQIEALLSGYTGSPASSESVQTDTHSAS